MRFTAAAAALAVLGGIACGCSDEAATTVTPTVSKEALQSDIAERLTTAGERPPTVTCETDLFGEVGRTARCDVVVNDVNSFQPIVTVTGIAGEAIEYELTPTLSQHQLEKAVERLVAETSSQPVDSVACESGLAGQVGAEALCDIDSGGAQARRVVVVTEVSGLTINFNLRTN